MNRFGKFDWLLTSNIMAGNAPQTPTSLNIGQVPAAQQQQPQSSTEELRGMVEQLQEHIQRLEG
jgi:uncharacterized FlaG/YvyC family protein